MEHAERDFFPDGCHSERCPSSYSLVGWRDQRNLLKLIGHRPEAELVSKRLELIEEFLGKIAGPDGYLPGINDGSRVRLPAAITKRLGQSLALQSSGFTIMCDGEHRMLINHGPSGGGHSHADCLSFELHAFGRRIAIDAGIGYTYDDPNHKTWYVRSRAHNMLT